MGSSQGDVNIKELKLLKLNKHVQHAPYKSLRVSLHELCYFSHKSLISAISWPLILLWIVYSWPQG